MIFVLTILPSWKMTQINAQILLALLVTVFTAHYLPYDLKIQNRQETLNELTVLFGSYYLFLFTNWIADEERRYELGWNLIGLIGLNICFNCGLAGFIGFKSLLRKLKLKYLKDQRDKKQFMIKKKHSIRHGHKLISFDTMRTIRSLKVESKLARQKLEEADELGGERANKNEATNPKIDAEIDAQNADAIDPKTGYPFA